MNIRIDRHFHGSKTVFSIAGRLSGAAVGQFKETVDQIVGPCVVDLSNLVFADDEGIDAIQASIDKGVQVQGASPFIELLLDNTSG